MTFGLALLTIQAFTQLNYNLIFLNIISMCVWQYKIIKTVKDEKQELTRRIYKYNVPLKTLKYSYLYLLAIEKKDV